MPAAVVWMEAGEPLLLAANSTKPRSLRKSEFAKLFPQPARSLTHRCGVDGCGPHGTDIDLFVVDETGEHVIARSQSEITAAEIVGSEVIWTAYGPYGEEGGVYRASLNGSNPTKLWDGAVTELLVDASDVYAAGKDGVAWIDLQSGRSTMLAKSSSPRGLLLHQGRVFWVNEYESSRATEPTGSLHSALRHGGAVTTHANLLPWPQALTINGRDIYWSSQRHSGVWSIPLTGGCVTTVVSTRFGCCGITWMHRTKRGLLIQQGDWMRNGAIQDLWLVPMSDR